MAKPKKLSKNIAIAGFVANVLLPGVGTIILGKYDIGTIQLVLALLSLSLFLSITAIGIPFFIAVWIWALITGIKALKKAKKRKNL
jgi:large-conductance mechanosensitive channel